MVRSFSILTVLFLMLTTPVVQLAHAVDVDLVHSKLRFSENLPLDHPDRASVELALTDMFVGLELLQDESLTRKKRKELSKKLSEVSRRFVFEHLVDQPHSEVVLESFVLSVNELDPELLKALTRQARLMLRDRRIETLKNSLKPKTEEFFRVVGNSGFCGFGFSAMASNMYENFAQGLSYFVAVAGGYVALYTVGKSIVWQFGPHAPSKKDKVERRQIKFFLEACEHQLTR